MQIADLKEKLDKQKTTVGELKDFQQAVLGQKVEASTVQAAFWLRRGEELTKQQGEIEDENWPEARTQAEMNAQAAERADEAQKQLIQTVLDVTAIRGKEFAASIQQSQDAWNTLVEVELEREAQAWEGGSIQPLMVSAKRESLIRERIATLKAELITPDGSTLEPKRSATPKNLLDHVVPAVPRARVEGWLGDPHFVYRDRYIYRFTDTQVEIGFNAQDAVSTITVALIHGETYEGTMGSCGEFTLGELTLGDLVDRYGALPLDGFESMRTKNLWVHLRLGPAGAWEYYYFGALMAYSGTMAETFFRYDEEKGKLLSDPHETIFNWIGLSETTHGAPDFDWQLKV